MGSQPFLVHTVAMKAAADLIVNPSPTHAFQSSLDKAERRAVIPAYNLIQQKEQNGFLRKFRRAGQPPQTAILSLQEGFYRISHDALLEGLQRLALT